MLIDVKPFFAFLMFASVACTSQDPPPMSSCPSDGQFRITWTIHGNPAATSCTGIDHLNVNVTPTDGCDGVVITPTLCTEGQMFYKELPAGPAIIELDAIDATGVTVASGSSPYDLESNSSNVAAIDLE
jgi:hypothetical protein